MRGLSHVEEAGIVSLGGCAEGAFVRPHRLPLPPTGMECTCMAGAHQPPWSSHMRVPHRGIPDCHAARWYATLSDPTDRCAAPWHAAVYHVAQTSTTAHHCTAQTCAVFLDQNLRVLLIVPAVILNASEKWSWSWV